MEDSTDFLATKIPSLEKFEDNLRCPICRELLLRAPKITECGHTFCGECIDRHLNNEKRCPLCRLEVQRAQLRANKSLESAVEEWKLNRDKLLHQLTLEQNSNTREHKDDNEKHEHTGVLNNVEIQHNPNVKTMSVCPICSKTLPISEIQGSHIDTCLQTNSSRSKRKRPFFEPIPTKKLSLPFFATLSDARIRILLAENGLISKGSRAKLIQRFQEYFTLYNNNLDLKTPEPVSNLRKKMSLWEKTQNNNTNDLKELDAKEWTSQHQTQFDELITSAKKTAEKKNTPEKNSENVINLTQTEPQTKLKNGEVSESDNESEI